MKSLHYVWAANLVYDDIDPILQCQCPQFMLPAPGRILLHILAMDLKWIFGFVLQLFHIRPKVVLVREYVFDCILTVPFVLVLVTFDLVGEGPEQTITVACHRLDLEALAAEFSTEFVCVFLLINLIKG